MSTPAVSCEAGLLMLKLHFIHQLPELMEQLTADCSGEILGHPDAEACVGAYRLAHTLAGTAGTFGLTEVSTAARDVEGLLALALTAESTQEDVPLLLGVSALQGAIDHVLAPQKGAPERPS